MEFTITALSGDSVRVESENWLMAMGKALPFFDVDLTTIARLSCAAAEDGSVLVEDGQRSWMIRQTARDVQVRVTDRSEQEHWAPLKLEPTASEVDPSLPRPDIQMPTESSLKKEAPQTLGEHLFELTMEADALPVPEACDKALGLILSFTKAEAGCVARGTLSEPGMRVVAARGPRAKKFLDRDVPFGEGLMGMCFDMRGTLLVNDVAGDTPHLDLVPMGESGLVSVVCVPLIDDEGTASGVVQIVNPPDRPFDQDASDVVETVARALATGLAGRV